MWSYNFRESNSVIFGFDQDSSFVCVCVGGGGGGGGGGGRDEDSNTNKCGVTILGKATLQLSVLTRLFYEGGGRGRQLLVKKNWVL